MNDAPGQNFAATAARHSLAWLVLGCATGLVCAAGLMLPAAGLPALSGYGRLVVVHLDVQLYGWCFLPVLALGIARLFRPDDNGGMRLTLSLWSAAVAAGVLNWLAGGAAGKVFLDWRGPALAALIASMSLIWALAARAAWERRAEAGNIWRWLALAGLAAGAAGFVHACDPLFLPPVNPHSGGATGHNLLASTLGFAVLVAIAAAVLFPGVRPSRARREALFGVFAFGALTHLTMKHGDVSHRETHQVIGLAFTVLLGAVLAWWMAAYPWRSRTPFRWFAFWWTVTAVDGVVIFLPGVLEHAKFSNALVAHAHWAMAGMVTALNLLILENLPGARVIFGKTSQRTWHLANLALGLALTLHACREDTGALWHAHDAATVAAYGVRLAAGAVMTGAATCWLAGAFDIAILDTLRRWRALWPAALLASFGACDLVTGVLLATMPAQTLAWMGIPDAANTPPGLTGLVGVFVGVVGAAYLVQARLWFSRERGALAALYWLTAAIRCAVAGYGFCAVIDGTLAPAWVTVPATDAVIAFTQVALRRRILKGALPHA